MSPSTSIAPAEADPLRREGQEPPSELEAYYANRGLLKRNIAFIIILTLGWSAAFTYLNPLMQLGLKTSGVSDSMLGLIGGINAWLYSYLVMYFSWKSDRTVSRFGRRIPFLMISAPVIVGTIILFPMFQYAVALVALYMIKAIFMDVKAATIPLLNIDCVPRHMLGRINAINATMVCVVSFLALRFGMGLADHNHYAPYWVGAAILAITSLIGIYYIKEPPIRQKREGRFLPWSAMKVAWQDKRTILLMAGVGLIQISATMCNAWIWLFADKNLGVSRGELGAIMSWGIIVPFLISIPVGILIDRFRGIRMVAVYWVLSVTASLWLVFSANSPVTLTIAAMIIAAMGPFYGAADIKVYREADPKDVGSITSTNSCLRALIAGLASYASGLLIQHGGGDYRIAFVFGAAVSTLGFICMLIHSRLNKAPRINREKPLNNTTCTRDSNP